MSELSRKVTELGGRLAELSRDGFAPLAGTGAIGASLAKLTARIAELSPDEDGAEWRAFCRRLLSFDALEHDLKTVEVARGLRLCRQAGGLRATKRRVKRDTESLPGIGPTTSVRLAERGLETISDLAWWIPRRYDDARCIAPLEDVISEATDVGAHVALRGRVVKARFARVGKRRWLDVRLTGLESDNDIVVVRWFHAHGGMGNKFVEDAVCTLAGTLKLRKGQAEMANPDIIGIVAPETPDEPQGGRILIRYPEVAGVRQKALAKACLAAARQAAHQIPDPVPKAVCERLGLPGLEEALLRLHDPAPALTPEEVEALNAGRSPWHERLAFGELFLLSLAIGQKRASVRTGEAPPCERTDAWPGELEGALPFTLTGAQHRAVEELGRDLASDQPMNRLLQGDVGSGKTAVIFAAALQAVRAGRQVALMAPTEILAEQHARTLTSWGTKLGLRVGSLFASLPTAVRSSTEALVHAGHLDIIVGTHALLSERLAYKDLGLVVIDEQHRFGVAQRVRLREGGAQTPHLLVATATPIPRTLALTAYGDLDVSVLDELPAGRQPVKTHALLGKEGRKAAYEQLKNTLAAGQRAFVICPLVEPPEDPDWEVSDATTTHEKLTAALPDVQVGLVHGRMSSQLRSETMAAFRTGEIQVLVATTVVEVGVDIPEATLMVIMDADRFGLAQLHQLRGRVGRGEEAADCLLVCRGQGAVARQRVQAMVESTDGFFIADKDLELRGPGELLGARQAGLPRLRFGDLVTQTELLLRARQEADDLLSSDPTLGAHPTTRDALAARLAQDEAYGAEGG